jgi:hypothetical protein
MKLQLNARNLFAFFLFALLMGEAHEIAHFITGKIICGCWPTSRDFNSWQICDCDLGFVATSAGPILSMTLAWIGIFLLRSSSSLKQSFGFALIWSNVPQARIMTVLMGGGDEKVVMRVLTAGTSLEPYYKWIAVLIVLIMALPPIIASFRAVQNKRGWLYNIGFMILPLIVIGAYGFLFLNTLLKKGFLQEVGMMGTPIFITLHTLLAFIVLVLFFRSDLLTYAKNKERELKVP